MEIAASVTLRYTTGIFFQDVHGGVGISPAVKLEIVSLSWFTSTLAQDGPTNWPEIRAYNEY